MNTISEPTKLRGKSYATEKTAAQKLAAFDIMIGDAPCFVVAQDGRYFPVVVARPGTMIDALAYGGITVVG